MGRPEPVTGECDVEEMDEHFLARVARNGDREAFDELVRRHLSSVYRLCVGLLGGGADAEDAAQETFVRAWQSLRRFDPTRPFGPWVRGIAVKVCQQTLRRRSGEMQRFTPLTGREADDAPEPVPDEAPLADEIMEVLAELDENYRAPLVLFYLHDASVAEVAESLGISQGATRVRLHRGREMLRTMLLERQRDGT